MPQTFLILPLLVLSYKTCLYLLSLSVHQRLPFQYAIRLVYFYQGVISQEDYYNKN